MANPLYNPQQNNPFASVIGQIKEFSKSIQGNPQEIVQNMLNNGQISQQELNSYIQQAKQIARFM